jgi:hypothetical protein
MKDDGLFWTPNYLNAFVLNTLLYN